MIKTHKKENIKESRIRVLFSPQGSKRVEREMRCTPDNVRENKRSQGYVEEDAAGLAPDPLTLGSGATPGLALREVAPGAQGRRRKAGSQKKGSRESGGRAPLPGRLR